jgi:hypothetical protein
METSSYVITKNVFGKGMVKECGKGKVKFFLCLTNLALYREGVWGSGYTEPYFFTSELFGGEWSATRPGRFIPEKDSPVTIR